MTKLRLLQPFVGSFPVTFPFGAVPSDPQLLQKYSEWGLRGHNGIDFGLPVGIPVVACGMGEVGYQGNRGDWGDLIIVKHFWGESWYAHLLEVLVNMGDKVNKGDKLGLSGATGNVTGPHLHFGIKPTDPDIHNGYLGFVDPSPYLK